MKRSKLFFNLDLIIIFLGVIIFNSDFIKPTYSINIDENEVTSAMEVYKDIDYSFLKDYQFGNTKSEKVSLVFDTVLDLKECLDANLISGTYIKTNGYYEIGDLGSATYLITNTQKNTSIELKNGLYAELIPDSFTDNNGINWAVISVKQFGAKGDGVNVDNTHINDSMSFADSCTKSDEYDRAIVYLPKGEYKAISDIIANGTNINLIGEKDETIIFTDNDYANYYEFFFHSSNSSNNFFGYFTLEAREVDLNRYKRQMVLIDCQNVYLYQLTLNVPSSAWSGKTFEDKQYTNLTLYAGDKMITVDDCTMYQLSGTYRGANIGIMDMWSRGTEDITIMNSNLYDNAKDEQVGIFSWSGNKDSYVKNVNFHNNTLYTYETPYKDIVGNRTMCFTIAYYDNQVENINIYNNYFKSEASSKFMTFGSVSNARIENNIFELQNFRYVFDSSAPSNESVLIDNNEFFITSKTPSISQLDFFSTGNLTATRNKFVSDIAIYKFVEKSGIFKNNSIKTVSKFGSLGSAPIFNNNSVILYAGHSGDYGEVLFQLEAGIPLLNAEYIGNIVNDYTYYNDKYIVYDRLSSINGVGLNSLNFSDNIYFLPNYKYTDETKNMYISWYRGANIKNLIIKNNVFQGAKGVLGYDPMDSFDSSNIYREFNSNIDSNLTSEIDITYNGEVIDNEIVIKGKEANLETIVRVSNTDNQDNDIVEVNNKNIEWLTSITSLADISSDGVVKSNDYTSVYVYATSTDGSGVYKRIRITFTEEDSPSIDDEPIIEDSPNTDDKPIVEDSIINNKPNIDNKQEENISQSNSSEIKKDNQASQSNYLDNSVNEDAEESNENINKEASTANPIKTFSPVKEEREEAKSFKWKIAFILILLLIIILLRKKSKKDDKWEK